MLKTNTKKARENIKQYIINNYDATGYEGIEETTEFKQIAENIINTFRAEKFYNNGRMSEYDSFKEWASGLPSIIDTCYYYNRSAVNDLAAILEETEEEKSKFTEYQAEERLTYLIYRELKNAID